MENLTKKYRKFIGLILIISTFLPFNLAHSAIYQMKDAQGQLHFSDNPQSNANPVILPAINYYQTQPKATTASKAAANSFAYKNFIISSPRDQETFHNTPTISVNLQLQPPLNTNHHLEIWLDGQLMPNSNTTQLTLADVARGTHTLQAYVRDTQQTILAQTPSVIFYVQQTRAS